MDKTFRSLFSYTDKVQFPTNLSLDEAAKKIDQGSRGQTLLTLVGSVVDKPTLMGWANKDEVLLHRIRPFIGNATKPYFYGKFIKTDKGLVLEGIFKMNRLARVWFSIPAFFALLLELLVLLTFSADPSANTVQFLTYEIPAFLAFLLAFIFAGKFLARNDVGWISKEIKEVLK